MKILPVTPLSSARIYKFGDIYYQLSLSSGGLSILAKCEAVGLHEFYHHSDILSCINIHIK